MKRKILITILLIIVFCGCMKFLFNPYARISRYVKNNQGNLRESCEYYLENGVTDDIYDNIKIDGIYGDTNKIVQFFWGGVGIVPSSKYYGFYYSPNDIAVSYCNEYKLTEVKSDEWTWKGVGDNGGVTRKICDYWYYYEAWF